MAVCTVANVNTAISLKNTKNRKIYAVSLAVSCIGTKALNGWIFLKGVSCCQNTWLCIMYIGSMNHHRQQISHNIHYDVPFASFCFFRRQSRALLRLRCFYALRVNNCVAGVCISFCLRPYSFHQCRPNLLPKSTSNCGVIKIGHCCVWWKIVGQISPIAAVIHKV